jgi:3-hydroxybutyryl-CoA dehydratase
MRGDRMKIGRTIEEFRVGQTFEYNRSFNSEETHQMGELIGDHNPFHYDGEFIKKTPFKKPIVHGMLVGGIICHFGGDIFPGPGYLAESMDFKFLKPVFFGQNIRFVGKVTGVDVKRKRVKFTMECFNEEKIKVLEANVVGIPFQVEVSD